MYNYNHRRDILIMRSTLLILLLITCASPGFAQPSDVQSNNGQRIPEMSAQPSEAVVSGETENAPILCETDAQTSSEPASDKVESQAMALDGKDDLEPEGERAQADTSGTLTPEEEAELMAALAADASSEIWCCSFCLRCFTEGSKHQRFGRRPRRWPGSPCE